MTATLYLIIQSLTTTDILILSFSLVQSNGNRTSSLNEDISTTDNTDVILFVKFILCLNFGTYIEFIIFRALVDLKWTQILI